MTTLTERIKADGIHIAASEFVTRVPVNGRAYPGGPEQYYGDQCRWAVTIGGEFTEDTFTVMYHMSINDGSKKPDNVAEIVHSVVMDSHAVDYDFEEWCEEYDFDVDSRKAEKTYKACLDSARDLRNFLGDEKFEEYLHETEFDV